MISQSIKSRPYVVSFPMDQLDIDTASIQYYIYDMNNTLLFVGNGYLQLEFNEQLFEVDLKDFYESIRNKNTFRYKEGLYVDVSTKLRVEFHQLDENGDEVGTYWEEEFSIDKEKLSINGVTNFYGLNKQNIKSTDLLLPLGTNGLDIYPVLKYRIYVPESYRVEPDVEYYEVVIDMFCQRNKDPEVNNNTRNNLSANNFTNYFSYTPFRTYIYGKGTDYFKEHYISKRYANYNWGLESPGVYFEDNTTTNVVYRKIQNGVPGSWISSVCNLKVRQILPSLEVNEITKFNIYSLATVSVDNVNNDYEYVNTISEFQFDKNKIKSWEYVRTVQTSEPYETEYETIRVDNVAKGIIQNWFYEQNLSLPGTTDMFTIELVGMGYDFISSTFEIDSVNETFTVSGTSFTRWINEDDFKNYKPTLTFINSDVVDKEGNDLTVPLMSELGFLKGNTLNKYTQTTYIDKYNDTYVVSADSKKTVICYICPDWLLVNTNQNKLNYVLLKNAMYSSRLTYLQVAMKKGTLRPSHISTALNGLTNPDDKEFAFLYGRIKNVEEVIIPSKYTVCGENMPSLRIEFEIYE